MDLQTVRYSNGKTMPHYLIINCVHLTNSFLVQHILNMTETVLA